ncbi:MAG: tRNA 2-thiouridine(34) synthase MnmA, partial [Shewanellaceae bacterium]|nr:tRNA 2-thiouridine(34) synthase MnmA [Shewanellaceae bacterium]
WDRVFEYFLQEYRAGRTPNPDIMCNKEIKFKAFLEFALEDLAADFIATGHYTRRTEVNGQVVMQRGLDANKDQSYFLYTLSEAHLAKTLFPVGELNKSEVRQIAEDLGLITAAKKDSTGICFIGERKFKDFLQQYIPAQPGIIETAAGEVVGEHQGLMYYTLGQRKGIGVGGLKSHPEQPWFVVAKDMDTNKLIIGQGHEHPRLMSTGLKATQLHWVNRQPLTQIRRLTVKTRYRQADVACEIRPLDADTVQVAFDAPVSAVTPGQSVVFYDGDQCLGGGIIDAILQESTPYA